MKNKQRMTIFIDRDIAQAVKILCQADGIRVSRLTQRLYRSYLLAREEESK